MCVTPQQVGESLFQGPSSEMLQQVEDMLVRAFQRALEARSRRTRVPRGQVPRRESVSRMVETELQGFRERFAGRSFHSGDVLKLLPENITRLVTPVGLGRILSASPLLKVLRKSRLGLEYQFRPE